MVRRPGLMQVPFGLLRGHRATDTVRVRDPYRSVNEEEARDTFKTLRNQQIATGCARLYHDWAQLESQSGQLGKAVSVLKKGISERAQPQE